MQAKAIAEGKRLIAREVALDEAFRAGPVTDEALRRLDEIEASRSALRYIHLSAHLTTPPLLSEAQITRYNALSGYGADPCKAVPDGHDPVMWRHYNLCD